MGLYEQVDYNFSGPLQLQDLFGREYVTMGGVIDHHLTTTVQSHIKMPKKPVVIRLNSDKVLFSFARGRERCDRNGHAVFLRPGVDFATTGSEITGISTSSTKLK